MVADGENKGKMFQLKEVHKQHVACSCKQETGGACIWSRITYNMDHIQSEEERKQAASRGCEDTGRQRKNAK